MLASLKPAGLFRYETRDCADLARRVKNWNVQLEPKGLRVRCSRDACATTGILCTSTAKAAVCCTGRRKGAEASCSRRDTVCRKRGTAGCGRLLTQLSRRLCCSADFPHEIGVFLGYPLGDVVGFIENRGKNFTCCGCWKSYGDRMQHRSTLTS